MPIMRFEIVKKGWWRPRYTILSDASVVGGIGEDTIRAESGTIEIGGIDYKIIGRGFFDKAYELHGEDMVIYARKPFSIFRTETTVEHEGRRYALTQVSTLNWYMLMHENGNLVGTIRKAVFSRAEA